MLEALGTPPPSNGVWRCHPRPGRLERESIVSVSDDYLEFVREQLERLGTIAVRRMFGGAGIYYSGHFFAIVVDDVLYFKVDDSNRSDYEAAGMEPFTFTANGKTSVMSFYEVPGEVLENREQAKHWALKAVGVAQAAKKKKSKKGKRKSNNE